MTSIDQPSNATTQQLLQTRVRRFKASGFFIVCVDGSVQAGWGALSAFPTHLGPESRRMLITLTSVCKVRRAKLERSSSLRRPLSMKGTPCDLCFMARSHVVTEIRKCHTHPQPSGTRQMSGNVQQVNHNIDDNRNGNRTERIRRTSWITSASPAPASLFYETLKHPSRSLNIVHNFSDCKQ